LFATAFEFFGFFNYFVKIIDTPMGDIKENGNPKYTFKLTKPRAPEVFEAPKIAVYVSPSKDKSARIDMYDQGEKKDEKKKFLAKQSRKDGNTLFIEVFGLYGRQKAWELKTEIIIPFQKSYRTGDIKKIIAKEFMGLKHQIYLFKGNSRDNIESTLADVLPERANKEDDTIDDLLVSQETIFFTAKVAIYDTRLKNEFPIQQWPEGGEADHNVILVESKYPSHSNRFVRIPFMERDDGFGNKVKTTVEDIRGYFAWKNRTLPQFIGLKIGNEYLNDNSRVIEGHEKKITAFVKRIKHPLIPGVPEEPFVPPSATLDEKTEKPVMKFKSQKQPTAQHIIVRCLGMKPPFIQLPRFIAKSNSEAEGKVTKKHPSSRKRIMVERTFKNILAEVSSKVCVDRQNIVFYQTMNDYEYDMEDIIEIDDKDNKVSDKQKDCPCYLTVGFKKITNSLKSKIPSVMQDWYDGLTDEENKEKAALRASYGFTSTSTKKKVSSQKQYSSKKKKSTSNKTANADDADEDDNAANNDDANDDNEADEDGNYDNDDDDADDEDVGDDEDDEEEEDED